MSGPGFSDPILGSGGTLVREAIISPDWDGDPADPENDPGTDGWALLRSGIAILNNAVVRDSIIAGTVDVSGDLVVGGDVTLDGTGLFRTSAGGHRIEMGDEETIYNSITYRRINWFSDHDDEVANANAWVGISGDDLSDEIHLLLIGPRFSGGSSTRATLYLTGRNAVYDSTIEGRAEYIGLEATQAVVVGLDDLATYISFGNDIRIGDGPDIILGGRLESSSAIDTTANVLADRFLAEDGGTGTPSYSFQSDTNTGFYVLGNDGVIYWSSNNNLGGELNQYGVRAGALQSANRPGFAFRDDIDAGLYLDQVGYPAIASYGNPVAMFHVARSYFQAGGTASGTVARLLTQTINGTSIKGLYFDSSKAATKAAVEPWALTPEQYQALRPRSYLVKDGYVDPEDGGHRGPVLETDEKGETRRIANPDGAQLIRKAGWVWEELASVDLHLIDSEAPDDRALLAATVAEVQRLARLVDGGL